MNGLFAELLRLLRLAGSRWGVYLLMIAGLVLSFSAAIVIGLFVYDELNYDRFIPNAGQVYFLSADYGPEGRPLMVSDVTPAGEARWIKTDIPEIAAVARLEKVDMPLMTARRRARQAFYWADANIFDVLRLPAAEGNLSTALARPGSVVMTRRTAMAYFGRADAIGGLLTTQDGVTLRVTALLRDFPANTHLGSEIFAAGTTPHAMLSILDDHPDVLWPTCYTYLIPRPGVSAAALQRAILDMTRRHWQGPHNVPVGFRLIPLLDIHFSPRGDGEMTPRGHLDTVAALACVAILVVCLAGINFAGLVLAETSERGAEMALRTALGARRRDLVFHVLREALAVYFVSAFLALAAVERLLPLLNRSLGLGLSLWSHPAWLLVAAVVLTGCLAVLTGLYPALVVSRPLRGNRDGHGEPAGRMSSERWRGWVIAQLALVIALLIVSHTMHRQWDFAIGRALHFDGKDVLIIRYSGYPGPHADFTSAVRALPGVESVAESWGAPTTDYVRPGWIPMPGGRLIALTRNSVSPSFLQVYRVPLLAGRNLPGIFLSPETPKDVLVNEAAVLALGYARPADIVGRDIVYGTDRTSMRSRVVGVVPDIRFATVYEPTQPMIFDGFQKYFTQVNVRLRPTDMAGTERDIDRLWDRQNGGLVPIDRESYADYLRRQYHDLYQQIQVVSLLSYVAIVLSTLGLTGLCILLTRHQVREIAIRRALGARVGDIARERMGPFLLPLAAANMIAWPTAWIGLRYWLDAFAEHVPMSIAAFIVVGGLCTAIALATIAMNTILSIRRAPISSLRHE
jgi:putative ABC transport system permease protein